MRNCLARSNEISEVKVSVCAVVGGVLYQVCESSVCESVFGKIEIETGKASSTNCVG